MKAEDSELNYTKHLLDKIKSLEQQLEKERENHRKARVLLDRCLNVFDKIHVDKLRYDVGDHLTQNQSKDESSSDSDNIIHAY